MSIPDNLHETVLYQRLKELVDDTKLPQRESENRRKALTLVDSISREAAGAMKIVPTLFPEYTLHDEKHLVRVTYLMGVILEEAESLEHLSYLELTILILAAYLHDIGMALPKEEVEDIVASRKFSIFRKTRQSELEGLREISSLLENQCLSEEKIRLLKSRMAEIEQSILTEYSRRIHGKTGSEYIINKWSNDPRWILNDYNVAEIVAWVCRGHTFHVQQLVSEYSDYYQLDKFVGQTPVNILYCSIILRLADILDFDRERTPQVLYENISPRNSISIAS